MTDIELPTHVDERALAEQIRLLADAAFEHSVVDGGAGSPGSLTADTIGNRGPQRRSMALVAAAAALLVVGFMTLWVNNRGVTELQTAGQPGSTATATAAPQTAEPIPEVVALPAGAALPPERSVEAEFVARSQDRVVLSRGEAWLYHSEIDQLLVSRNRGLGWVTFNGPASTTRPGCLHADEAQVVATSLRDDGQQWLTTHRHAGPNDPMASGTDAILPEASLAESRGNAGRPLYCRPAKVDGRWAVAASDGASLTVVRASNDGQRPSVTVLALPEDQQLDGGNYQTDLYADGDRFVAAICMVVESICSTTTVSFPSAALDSSGELYVHAVGDDENPTKIAERFGITLRDLLAANPSLVEGADPWARVEWKIPGVGLLDPVDVVIGDPFVQAHPRLYEGRGMTWQVVALDVDDDPEITYSGPGQYAVGAFDAEPVLLPDADVWRVDVFPSHRGARVRVWRSPPSEPGADQRWYDWSEIDRSWVALADPVRDWATLADWTASVSFVEMAPSGRIRVLLQPDEVSQAPD